MITLNAIMQIGTMYGFKETDVWADIVLDRRLDKDVLIMTILRNCAQSYPYINTYGGFKQMSDSFFKKWSYQITKLIDTQEFEYNPIWNKDGKIVEQHDLERGQREDIDDSFSENEDINSNSTDSRNVSPYNTNGYQPESQDVISSNENRSRHNERNTGRKHDESLGENTVRTEQGNIGLTSTQQLISEERQLYEFNIYDWIVEKYHKELFMKVW